MTSVKAAFIGCSYDGQDPEMQAGKHDVLTVAKFIKDQLHISASVLLSHDEKISIMLKKASSYVKILQIRWSRPRENILSAIEWLVSDDQYNEQLFFHFAGHGGSTLTMSATSYSPITRTKGAFLHA